jgi:hypothetical protein
MGKKQKNLAGATKGGRPRKRRGKNKSRERKKN